MDIRVFTWLLEVDIRAKNATAMLCSLAAMALTYFSISDAKWFTTLTPWGQGACLFVILLMSFLIVWLTYAGIHILWTNHRIRKTATTAATKVRERIRENLESLTMWQRQFVVKFIAENRTQIPEWEIGRFRAAYGPELDVLVTKGIVIEHLSGVYELRKPYFQYLKEHWNPDDSTLE